MFELVILSDEDDRVIVESEGEIKARACEELAVSLFGGSDVEVPLINHSMSPRAQETRKASLILDQTVTVTCIPPQCVRRAKDRLAERPHSYICAGPGGEYLVEWHILFHMADMSSFTGTDLEHDDVSCLGTMPVGVHPTSLLQAPDLVLMFRSAL